MPKFAEVAVYSYIKSADDMNLFDYSIPERYIDIVRTGMKVIVPFGKNRLVEGYIINLKDSTDIESTKLKSISEIRDFNGFINEKQIMLARWISEEYMCTLADSLKCIMPPEVNDKVAKGIELCITSDEVNKLIKDMENNSKLKKQSQILETIKSLKDGVLEKVLVKDYGFSKSSISTLAQKGIIKYTNIKVYRDPFSGRSFETCDKPVLTFEQRAVVDRILSGYHNRCSRNYLIHGVTGSGKTEVYMQLIEHVVNEGKKAIMLVPEISLTPQTIERFKGRFGRVAVMHSRLSAGERHDELMRIKDGDVDVVIGARSAVFAPFENLGIIVIDEEHENSYKSDKTPKYHTREVAYKRCEIENALLVLGSATPSVETYYEASIGRYSICRMKKRVGNKKLPYIYLADMRKEMEDGNKTIFSKVLHQGIRDALDKKNQIILFLNRRGFSTFVSCRKCGLVMKCPKCDVSLTYHMDKNMLNCHYCGYAAKVPDICPSCKSNYIKYFGVGTQKVESEVKKYFPDAKVLRMDFDTTSAKGSHERIYNAFKNNEADILIGTQMISKGLDFKGVTLVGIIAADLTLNIPDYKSSERTFQLITQVSGRAGRGSIDGLVIVQTYSPMHYSIQAAMHNDYVNFYNKEILIRKSFIYPPFSSLMDILVSSQIDKEAKDVISQITDKLKCIIGSEKDITILGPSRAPISKINTYYRWQTIIKGTVGDTLKKQVKELANTVSAKNISTKISIDINPSSMA